MWGAAIVRAMRWFVVVLVLCAGVSSRAAGQAKDPWLIVVTTSAMGNAWMEPTASKLRTELLKRRVEVWSLQGAATRFGESGSAAPAAVTDEQIAAWADQSRAGLWRLAAGEFEAALDQLNEAQELSRSTIETLARNDERAQKVLDTCLYTVRALLETGFSTEANALGRECRTLVPRGQPTKTMHPGFVLDLFETASRVEQPSALKVESEPSGCIVRVNGLVFGETPLQITDLLPAQYRVQVECDPGPRGRVHTVDTRSGPGDVFVDLRFDRAVATDPLLHLRYANVNDEQQQRIADAERVAEAVPASALLLMSMPTPRMLELELLGGTPREQTALSRISMGAYGASPGDIALAARALVEGRCTDFTTVPPLALSCEAAAPLPPAEEVVQLNGRPRGQRIAGFTLIGIGSVSLLTGYALLFPRARAGEDWVAQVDSSAENERDGVAQQRWLNMGTTIVFTSSVGAGALVAAMPLILPNRAKTPWWAWFSGGLGVGLAAFSVAYGVTADPKPSDSCANLSIDSLDAQACVKHGEQTTLAVVTGVTAAPLLTIPLVYLFRRDKARVTPSIEVSRTRGYFGLRGEF